MAQPQLTIAYDGPEGMHIRSVDLDVDAAERIGRALIAQAEACREGRALPKTIVPTTAPEGAVLHVKVQARA